jgi:hypothetical protein
MDDEIVLQTKIAYEIGELIHQYRELSEQKNEIFDGNDIKRLFT